MENTFRLCSRSLALASSIPVLGLGFFVVLGLALCPRLHLCFFTILSILNHLKSLGLSEVDSSRTSLASRTHFEVLGLGLGLEASNPSSSAASLEDKSVGESDVRNIVTLE